MAVRRFFQNRTRYMSKSEIFIRLLGYIRREREVSYMGQKDAAEKILEDYQDVFADILNVLVFQGKQVVKPEELCETKVLSHYKAEDGKLHEQERDVAKFWKKGGIIFSLCGLENQTVIDPDMPLRVIGYDGAAYRGQLLTKGKEAQRYPVMTLVLYYGKQRWKASKNLKERIHVPKALEGYISDYRVNIFEISYLSEQQISMFRSDFQIVADYFVQVRKNQGYKENKKIIRHVDAMLKFLSVFTGDQDYAKLKLSKNEGGINMCVVLQEAIERGKREGIEFGIREGIEREKREIASGMLRKNISIKDICELTGLSKQQVRALME